VLPTIVRVSVNQLGSTSPVAESTPSAPIERAISPTTTPSTRPIRTWTPKEGSQRRLVGAALCAVELIGMPFAGASRGCARRRLRDVRRGAGGASWASRPNAPRSAATGVQLKAHEVDDEAMREEVAPSHVDSSRREWVHDTSPTPGSGHSRVWRSSQPDLLSLEVGELLSRFQQRAERDHPSHSQLTSSGTPRLPPTLALDMTQPLGCVVGSLLGPTGRPCRGGTRRHRCESARPRCRHVATLRRASTDC
jgi:hypothetical protein